MSKFDVSVMRNTDSGSYDAMLGDEMIGTLLYFNEGAHVALTHMFVMSEYRDRGVAHTVIETALDDIRASGRTVTVLCDAVRRYMHDHPDQQDLISADHPGLMIA